VIEWQPCFTLNWSCMYHVATIIVALCSTYIVKLCMVYALKLIKAIAVRFYTVMTVVKTALEFHLTILNCFKIFILYISTLNLDAWFI
jgi:hypothetical protein